MSIEITAESIDFLVQECKHALIMESTEKDKKRTEDPSRYASPKAIPRRRTMDGSPMSPAPTVLESTPSSAPGGFTPRRSPRTKTNASKQKCYYLQQRRAYMAKITKANGQCSYKSFRVASPRSAARMKQNAKAAAIAWIKSMGGKGE